MPTYLEPIQAFAGIEVWADGAIKLIQADPSHYSVPPLDELIKCLTGGVFLNAELGEKDEKGRALIGLSVNGPRKADGSVTRFMLPTHAALTRVLESSGARIAMIRGSGGGIEKFYLDIVVSGRRTNIHRLLFGLASSGRLWEQPLPNGYRSIVPASYRVGKGISRSAVLAETGERLEKLRVVAKAEPSTIISVLTTLFTVGDHWHWDELEGRSKSGDGERFRYDQSL